MLRLLDINEVTCVYECLQLYIKEFFVHQNLCVKIICFKIKLQNIDFQLFNSNVCLIIPIQETHPHLQAVGHCVVQLSIEPRSVWSITTGTSPRTSTAIPERVAQVPIAIRTRVP